MVKSVSGKEAVSLEGLLSGAVSAEQVEALSFEQALKLLEEVVVSVESGNLPLDRAIGSYEKARTLEPTFCGRYCFFPCPSIP